MDKEKVIIIAREFRIKTYADFSDLRKKLNKVRTRFHPDKFQDGGYDEKIRSNFQKISEAIAYIDEMGEQNNSDLQVLEKKEIVQSQQKSEISEILIRLDKLNSSNIILNLKNNALEKLNNFTRSTYLQSKVSSGFIVAFSVFLFSLSESIGDLLLVSGVSETLIKFTAGLLGISGAMLAFYGYVGEQRAVERKSTITSEVGFLAFVYSSVFRHSLYARDLENYTVTELDISELIGRFYLIDDNLVASEIAKYFIELALSRKIFFESPSYSIERTFFIPDTVVDKLNNDCFKFYRDRDERQFVKMITSRNFLRDT
jgi:hypothetical protein